MSDERAERHHPIARGTFPTQRPPGILKCGKADEQRDHGGRKTRSVDVDVVG